LTHLLLGGSSSQPSIFVVHYFADQRLLKFPYMDISCGMGQLCAELYDSEVGLSLYVKGKNEG